jgi:hypothetical protein
MSSGVAFFFLVSSGVNCAVFVFDMSRLSEILVSERNALSARLLKINRKVKWIEPHQRALNRMELRRTKHSTRASPHA